MKKNILIFAAIATTLCSFMPSCGYKVSGTVVGAHDGDTVKISTFEGFSETVHATALVKKGKFTFTGTQDEPVMRYLSCGSNGKSLGFAQFILENGDIEINLDSSSYKYDIKGTELNEQWCKFYNEEETICGESLDLYRATQDSTLSDEARAAKIKAMNAKDAEIDNFRLQFIRKNINNVAGAYVLVANSNKFDKEEVARLVDLIPASVNMPELEQLKTEIENERKTALNQPFTDFAMQTPEGTMLSVSDVAKNAKVTMIDFWASWCGPCRAEMPAVKAAYEKYHSKGFEIIGVSLDNNKEAWVKAIASLGLKWKQVSDLKGWKCEGAKLYGVKAIPATVLIVDGKIVARNLRGEAIEKKLAEILK